MSLIIYLSFNPLAGKSELRLIPVADDFREEILANVSIPLRGKVNCDARWRMYNGIELRDVSIPLRGKVNCDFTEAQKKAVADFLGFNPLAGKSELRQ